MKLWLPLIIAVGALGMPLFCVLGGVGIAGYHAAGDDIAGAFTDVYRLAGAEAVLLSTIPLFTFAGYLMAKAKTAQRIVAMAESVLGWIPGGLALMTLWTCAFFTVFTGASGVTIVALGGLMLPALENSKYKPVSALGVVTGSGTVGLLFPPALPLIVYGIIFALNAGQAGGVANPIDFSIEKFLLAGIVPGLVLVGILSIYCVFAGWQQKVPTFPIDLGKFKKALWAAKWELPIPFVVIYLIVGGKADPAETAALTALYVFIIEVFIYKDIDIRKDLFNVSRESMTLVGAIFMKIAGATLLKAYLVQANVPDRLFEWLSQYVHTKVAFLLVLNVFLLIVGCLMDIFSAIIVVVPLIVPAAAQFHIDPYHLGVIFLLNLEIGYLLPPAGLNLFIAAFRFNRPITTIYRAVVPFIALMIVALLLVTYIPKLTVVPKSLPGQKPVPAATTPIEGEAPPPP
jgi:tripartite ATP-independent transporter DctM subunit